MYSKTKLAYAISTMATLAVTSPLFAAEADSGAMLEEVVVTAQRRAENLQEVPISVSAFSANTIRDADLQGLEDIATRVPSLTFSPFAPGQSIISLRGVSSNDDGAGTDNSVAVFLDDVYVGGLAAVAFDLFDLESVEVLRGPQGTLFGKNAIGGAINIRSIKPSTEEVKGRIEGTIGNYGQRDIRGYITGPLGDNFAGKITLSSRQNDGYVRNELLGKDQKDQDTQSVRGQLLYHTDDFEALLTAEFTKDDTEDMGRIPLISSAVPGAAEAFIARGGDRDHVFNPLDGFSDRESTQFSLRLTKQFDSGELISITGWRDFESEWHMDSVGVPFGAPGANLNVNDDITEEVDAVSQEFRWASDLDGNLNFVAGLFYLQEDTHRIERFHINSGIGTQEQQTELAVDTSDQDNETTSFAAFGQLTWNATEKITVNVGLRYTEEEKEFDNISISGGFGIINDSFSAKVDEDWDDVSPKLSIDYQITDEVLIYASAAEGFKSGGFPAAPSRIIDLVPIDPEEATSYEIGVKADLFDSTLRINASTYFLDYTDLQIQRFGVDQGAPPGSFGVFQTLNAGDAEVTGFELESTWLVTENITLSGTYSYTDSEFVDTVLIDATGNPRDISGQDLTRAPKTKYALSAEYSRPTSYGEIKARLDYRYTGFNRQDIFSDLVTQPGFHVADARVSWSSNDDHWEVALWGKNLDDEEYIAHGYIVGPGVIIVYGDPRTYGVTLTYNYH